MSCVVKTKAFKETAKRLGISEAQLEQIAYEYINQEEGNDFPSDSYVISKMYGEENIVLNDDQIKIWDAKYNLPKIFETREQAEAYKADASRYFNPAAIPVIQLPNGSYKVQVNQPTKENIGGVTILTPLKEEYKGKLIFAQSRTGKSAIADNVNVIDGDIILADIIGVSPESAIFVFNNMESAQKQRILERYKEAIQETVKSGKTVVTASTNVLNEADVIIYNANAEITNNRTNSPDRQGRNRYSDLEYHSSVLEKVNTAVNSRPEVQSIRLSADKFLSDYLLTDPTFKVVHKDQKLDTLHEAVENFLEAFDMSVNSLQEYDNNMPLFDTLNRTINIKSEEDITEGMGYAIAFMMQHDPQIKTLILHKMFPGIESVPGVSEGFINRLANREQGNISIPQPLRRFVGGREVVKYTEIYSRFPTKNLAIHSLGKDIAEALKQEYGYKPKKGIATQIFDALKSFFNRITRPSYEGMKASTIHYIVDSIMRGDPSLIRGSLYKPGSTEKADLLDIETAFKENPYEEDIISKLSEIGIALTGSTAIRTEASIYRPSENPLHDIDFSCPNGTTKSGLEESLNKIFPNIQHVRTIQSKDNSKNYTETYLVLSHPYVLKPHNTVPTLKLIVDPKTGKQLGVMNLFNQEINLEEGVQGKLLDFFIGESPTIFEPKIKRIAGKKYLISDPRNAMLAKVTWQRKKDIWDYRNFIRIFSDKRVFLKTKGIQADLNKIKANKWNLSPEAVKEVESKLKQYMQEKEGSIQDVNVADYFTESNSTTASNILQHIINNSTNSDIVELANYVLDSLGNKADTIVKFNAKKKTGTRGTYTSATGQVHINKASLTGNTEAEAIRNMESTIVHEIVHALTVEAIESDAKIRKDLISLFKDFKELSVQYGIDLGYAAKNPKEFVSEFLGRPAFREALKVIPSNTKKSWFKRTMDFIKSVLHIDTKSSFYDRADDIIEKLLIDSNTKDYSHIDAISEDLNRYYIDRSEGSRAKVTTLKEQRISEIEKQLHNEEQVMSLMDIALRDRLPRDKARQLGKLRKQLKAYCDSYGVSMRMDDDFNIFNNISTLQNELAVLEQPNFEEIVVEQWYQKFAQERADETQAELDLLFRDDYEEGSTSSPVNDKFIKSDILSTEVLNTLNTVAERSTHITLDEATHVYTKDGKKLDTSATSILHDPWEAEKPINGNTWLGYDVAGPLGTTTDVIMRDYFSGTLKQSYPNMTNDQVKNFVENEAPKVREHLDARFGKGNYEVITDDKYLRMAGTIFLSDPIKNKQGQVILSEGRHTIGATMDMLVVTKDGLYYPYDFKTKRSNGGETFNSNVYQQYSDQVSGIYPQLLEVQNPELKGKVQKGSLIQFNHKYEAPLGSRDNERNGTGMFMKDARGQVYRYKYNTTTRQWEYNPIQSAIAADGTPAYTPPTFYRVHESISGKRRNIISYDAPTVMNPTYIVGMKEFNGMELIYGTIGVRDGIAIGAQNAHDGTIRIDIQALKEKYETKAWKQSKRSEDINRDFDTFEEFVSFVLTHEYAHNYIRPVTISMAGYGIVTQQIADQMKQAYLQGKQALNNYIARLPKDVQRTAIVYLHGTYGIDINLNPLSKSQIENKRVLYEAIFYKRPTATESALSYETRVNNEALRIIDEYKQNKESATKREYTAREEQLLSNINPSIKDFIGNPLDPAKIVVGDTVKDYLDNEFKVLGFIDENNVVLENSKGFISSKRLISTNKSTYLYKQNQEVLTPSATDTAPTVEGLSTAEQIKTKRAYYEGNITPDANTVFVFGSNPEGKHGLGAAKTAREQFGAQYGVGEGMTGNAYALPTKDLQKAKGTRWYHPGKQEENEVKEWYKSHDYSEVQNHPLNSERTVSPQQIINSIQKLYEIAKQNPTKQFKVSNYKLGELSLNGYLGEEMVEMFKAVGEIPANIVFSKEWVDTGKFDTPVETEITKELGPKTEINIYAGTNENADLSNFAVRPFITTNVGENPSGPIAGKFNTVEGAFQAQKLYYTDSYTDAEKQNIISKLEKASGGEARRIGKNIHGLNIKAWDSVSTSLMKNLLIESFKQNPQALQKLLDTGNATLTHKQDKGKWGTEFPRLLMEVREELKPSTSSSSTDEVFRFNEEQGKEFTRLFGPYDEGGGADINKLFKQPLPREVDMDISQYNWEGVYPPNSSMQWILDNIKDEYKPALSSFFSSEMESGPQVTTSSVMTSSEDIDLGDDVPAYEKSEKQKEIDKEYTGKQKTIMEQVNTLMRHPDIKPAEVRHIAEQCVYWISDRLTDYQTTPEKLFNNFPDKRTLNAEKEWTEEAKQKDIEKVTNMNREQILRFIGIDNLYEACRLQVFVNNELIQNDFDLMDKADAIAENFAAIRILAADTFTAIEKFSIKLDERGNLSTTSDVNKQEDDNQRENDEAQEYGNQQEHWQIESRTQDVLFSATEEVRRLLNNCYKMRADGTIIDSEFGVHERMTAKDATSSILRWTQGSLDLNDMIAKMQAKKAEHPWIQQVIDKLSDRSGKYADLQSQFFGVMQKHFQPYCVVIKENGVYKSIPVNEHPALTEATRSIKTLYNIGQHPLFNSNGINRNSYKTLEALHTQLQGLLRTPLNDSNIEQAVNVVGSIATVLGYTTLPEHVKAAIIQPGKLSAMARSLTYIVGSLSRQLDNENYDPFNFNRTTNPDGISGNLRDFLEPLTEQLEDIAVSSFYDSGKMYQSYVTPSYMTKLMNKFHDSQERFLSFIEDEYGKYEWFRESGQRRIQDGWKNEWLRELVTKGEDVRKELFKHKVELNFNKHNYMKNMSDSEYTLSLLTEYFSASAEQSKGKVLAWYNIPMLSNKPSSEFIQFYRYTSNYRNILTDGFYKIFLQELGRIQTCEERASKLPQDALIKNFDTFKKGTAKEKRGNGTKFMFLEFMNAYLEGGSLANSELGKIINKKLRGEELSPEQENTLITKTKEAIQTRMDAEAESTLQKWEESGILEGAKNIENIGSNEEEIKESIRQYVWNSTFASMNILQLTITDIAYYKDAEDLQKRLAQIHAPGIRANKLATDYEGNLVSDGNFRSLILTDWDNFKSNITSNLEEVFDKKINAASSKEKPQWQALKNNIIEAFSNINVADAQGFSSPTSYRKKAFLFGKWSKKYEDIYQKLMSGKYTYSDLEFAFQPLKPFVYSQNAEPSRVEAPMSQLKVGTQFKNSEYLLILADAILKGERTGRPNLLRAIYNIMEDSANIIDKTKGIDTVQFESTTKAGLKGKLNLLPFINHPNGEQAAYDYMKKAIFNATVEQRDGLEKPVTVLGYNDVYVKTVDFEDYCLQQEVPEHFKDHSQAHGSQIRYIIPSDLEEYHSDGVTPVKYSFMDKGVKKELSAEEFKKEYEDNIYQNIQESIQELSQELGLGKFYTSIKDRNIALSKILQREILSSPRYGIDLLIACSVDEATGEFRIPLGDPIQSKRVEQLINSIIKNRVNKQKIAGGPIVQVSNFGTSKELNIRFNDKNGNLLKTEAEFTPSEKYPTYKDYIKAEQAGIAYYEVFVPIYANELFKEFADDKGNINIEDIEAVAPDMLKMIGYRIPSEDKYSCAPMKVVGFLPREAGDAIMLPADITTITGSDFDVDKFYVMRKEILLSKRVELKEGQNPTEAELDYIKHNRISIINYLRTNVTGIAPISQAKRNAITKDVTEEYELRKRTETRRYKEEVEKIESRNDQIEDAIANVTYSNNAEKDSEIYDKKVDKQEKQYQKALENAKKKHEAKLAQLDAERDDKIEKLIEHERYFKTTEFIIDFLRNPHQEATNSSLRALKYAYMNYMYRAIEETSGRSYRNNKIIDMTWAVLTHETTAEKILNPGGFDEQKGMGYAVEAQRLNPDLSWDYLEGLSTTPKGIDTLKDLCYTSKNICYPIVNIQFYKQNSAAGAALGMAAVQKVAHAVLEGNGYQLDIDAICNLPQNENGDFIPFTIAGKTFGGGQKMEMDPKFNDEGALIGKTLGSEVAMFADAVKDPVANLMNINGMMMPIVNSLVRLGMPFRNVALFTSQSVIRECLLQFNTENISNYVSISDIINKKKKKIEDDYNLNQSAEEAEMSSINTEELTKEELIKGINPNTPKAEADAIAYKVLTMWQYISRIADAMRGPTFATRFNSISNAVGPQIVDNLIMEHKQSQFSQHIYNAQDEQIGIQDIFDKHPILRGFNQTLDIATELFGNMPANSNAFKELLSIAPENIQRKLYGDKKLLSQLTEFFLSYMLVANGTIDTSKLKEYITQFPAQYLSQNYKEKYPDNALIQAIKPDYEKKSGRAVLKVDTTGLDTKQKEELSTAWVDLHNQNPELSEKLFIYNFFKGGVVFSPKTFMALVHPLIKEQLFMEEGKSKYLETYRHSANIDELLSKFILDQFIRNNWDNNKLVPKVKFSRAFNEKGQIEFTSKEDIKKYKDLLYMKNGFMNNFTLFKQVFADDTKVVFEKVQPLGNNHEYIEMSRDNIIEALDMTVKPSEEDNNHDVPDQSRTDTADIIEEPIAKTEVQQQQNDKFSMQNLYEALASHPAIKTIESAKSNVEDFKARWSTFDNATKEAKKQNMMNVLLGRYKAIGINLNQEELERVFNLMC